jgi:hypothetical protein
MPGFYFEENTNVKLVGDTSIIRCEERNNVNEQFNFAWAEKRRILLLESLS